MKKERSRHFFVGGVAASSRASFRSAGCDLIGLGLASGAADDVICGTGLGPFVFGVLFIIFLIRRNVGR